MVFGTRRLKLSDGATIFTEFAFGAAEFALFSACCLSSRFSSTASATDDRLPGWVGGAEGAPWGGEAAPGAAEPLGVRVVSIPVEADPSAKRPFGHGVEPEQPGKARRGWARGACGAPRPAPTAGALRAHSSSNEPPAAAEKSPEVAEECKGTESAGMRAPFCDLSAASSGGATECTKAACACAEQLGPSSARAPQGRAVGSSGGCPLGAEGACSCAIDVMRSVSPAGPPKKKPSSGPQQRWSWHRWGAGRCARCGPCRPARTSRCRT